ncbi:MAG: hypothetical protein HC836_41070 [Richelia sp. RM2_1_2]|nr:hypothetical protein [Richelia sp. RM2_1_2]
MTYTKDKNFYELRFLLHGIKEEYNSDKPLYITSQKNYIWQKIACKTIEPWRIVPPDLANILSKDWRNKLNIQEIIAENIISDLSPELIKASDFPSTEEKEELLRQIFLAKKEELWKKIPLHETVEGKFVYIDNQTYLENPNYSCDDKLRNIVKIIKSTSNLQKNLIPLWTPEAAINIIIQQPNIGHFYLLLLELIPEASNELKQTLKKLKWLPSRSGGGMTYPDNVVNLAEHLRKKNDTLEDELERVFITEKSKYVMLSKLNVENQYLHRLKDIRSNWNENNVLKFLLSETSQTHEYCNLILKTLKLLQDRKQPISKENLDLLRNKLWLVDSRGKAIGINKIIYFPALSDEFTNILTQLELWNYVTPKMLNEGININFCLEHNQLQYLFCTNKDAIREVGNVLNQLPNYHIGDFDIDSFPINEFIQVFKGFTELPALALREKISEGDFQEFILPNILKPINNHDKLIKILQWIHENYQKPSEVTIKVYNKYLELTCRDSQVFAKEILPKIQLLNQNGQWKSPSELCDGNKNTGIDKDYVLNTEQQQILSEYLNKVKISTDKKKTSVNSSAKFPKKHNTNIAEHLDKYFFSWRSYISSEAIGGFLCLLAGNNTEIQELSKSYLQKRNFNEIRDRFLWSDDLKSKEFIINIQPHNITLQSVNNLFGNLFKAQILRQEIPNHLFVGELDKDTEEINLVEFPLQESFADKLSKILEESANLLINKFYKTNLNESFDEIWQDLATSKQLDILSVRNFILKNGYFLFQPLVKPNTEISKYLSNWRDADAEITSLNSRRNKSDTKVSNSLNKAKENLKKSKEAIKKIIHKNNQVSNEILTVVRQKIGQGQYGYNFTSVLFELFQNADDSVAELQQMVGNISQERLQYIISWDEQCLTVMHWGRPINLFIHSDTRDKNFKNKGFDQDLLKMLCFNFSDKSEDTTGKFGLGFKTVHLISKEPIIISDDLCFSIHAGLLPFALEDLELERRLRHKLQSQQLSSGITDGTLINLKLDTDVITDVHEIISDFEEKISLLLVFSKFIKTCKLISNSSLQQSLTWTPIEVLGIPGIEFGQVKILDKTHNLLCFRIEDATVAIALPENFADKTSPLSNFPTFWVTTPTKETLSLRFLINAMLM